MYTDNIITYFENVCVDNQSRSNTGLYNLTHFTHESFRMKTMQNVWILLFSEAN